MYHLDELLPAFKGTPKKIQLWSEDGCFIILPRPDEEKGQRLTIYSDGRVWFSGYNYPGYPKKHKKLRSRYFRIEAEAAKNILNRFVKIYSKRRIERYYMDTGEWDFKLFNTDNEVFYFAGCLWEGSDTEGVSDLVRKTLGMYDLMVLDGDVYSDPIEKITFSYQKMTKMSLKQVSDSLKGEVLLSDYRETLILDREKQWIEYVQEFKDGYKTYKRYEIGETVAELLDDFAGWELFEYIDGNPEDVVETPDLVKDYEIKIDYEHNPQKTIKGTFDKHGLPIDFADFVYKVSSCLHECDRQEIFNPLIFNKPKRRKSEWIYCSVIFEAGSKTYYYLTDDDTIEVGDFVMVPAGADNHLSKVEVIKIDYFDRENAPLPLDKTKWIIGKWEEVEEKKS